MTNPHDNDAISTNPAAAMISKQRAVLLVVVLLVVNLIGLASIAVMLQQSHKVGAEQAGGWRAVNASNKLIIEVQSMRATLQQVALAMDESDRQSRVDQYNSLAARLPSDLRDMYGLLQGNEQDLELLKSAQTWAVRAQRINERSLLENSFRTPGVRAQALNLELSMRSQQYMDELLKVLSSIQQSAEARASTGTAAGHNLVNLIIGLALAEIAIAGLVTAFFVRRSRAS